MPPSPERDPFDLSGFAEGGAGREDASGRRPFRKGGQGSREGERRERSPHRQDAPGQGFRNRGQFRGGRPSPRGTEPGPVRYSPVVKAYRGLLTEKGRLKERRFLIEGTRGVHDVLAVSPSVVNVVLLSEDFKDAEIRALVRRHRVATRIVPRRDIEALSQTETPQGILAVADFGAIRVNWDQVRHATLLDAVQDPGNVGAVFRTSLALGMDALVLGKGSCEPYNPKVVRSSVGALLRLPFEAGVDLPAKLPFLRQKGFTVLATSPHANATVETVKMRRKVALIVGNEAAGTGARIMDLADAVVKIPLKSQVESLNVSVAHGILSYLLLQGRR